MQGQYDIGLIFRIYSYLESIPFILLFVSLLKIIDSIKNDRIFLNVCVLFPCSKKNCYKKEIILVTSFFFLSYCVEKKKKKKVSIFLICYIIVIPYGLYCSFTFLFFNHTYKLSFYITIAKLKCCL